MLRQPQAQYGSVAGSQWGHSTSKWPDHTPLGRYHWRMKTSYLFGAILVCSLAGALVGQRATKTMLLVTTGVISAYGLFRIFG